MTDITLVKQKLPSTNSGWDFGGARSNVAFVPEGEVAVENLNQNGRLQSVHDGWVFGIACYRHLPDHGFLRNNDLNIVRSCGSVKSAERFIEKYYINIGKTVAFK